MSQGENVVSGVLVRDIASFGRFYRLVFLKSSRYSIVVEVGAHSTIKINGVEPVPAYYDLLINANFRGYGELSTLVSLCRKASDSAPPTVMVTITEHREEGSQDINCLRFNRFECVRCAYRFYLKNGKCVPVPDSCK